MILALNANAAIDQVLFIERFLPGGTMRPTRSVLSVGGKSLDAAVVIKTLGGPVEAISFIAGQNGKILQGLLDSKGIPSDLIWLEGDTRVSYVLVETEYNRHSHITTTGYQVTAADCEQFLERVSQHAHSAAWAVLAGSLPGGAPPDFYCQQVALLHQFGVKSLIDSAGPAALRSLPAGPDILKMNQAEFCATFPEQSADLRNAAQAVWVQACREVMRLHRLQNFVITCGADGILALTPDASYHAAAPLMPEVNAAGSGDAVSGTLAYRFSLGDSWETALRWSAAAGAAVVLTEGTAECRIEDVLAILPQTQVRQL
jgi:1-phosphofructokinase family hexose kinase